MNDPETLPAGVHPEAALLPWYANGTLRETDQQQVDRHLESCQDCRRELDELTQVKRDLAAFYQSQPAPSPRLARSVMAKVAAERRVGQARQPEASSWLNEIDEWFRSLLLPRWVPTLAAVLLVAQMGLLLWVGLPRSEREQVSTRSFGMQTAKITIAIQPTATEEQIRSLLQSVRGRVVDGPTPEGRYHIEVPAVDEAAKRQKLDRLRGRTDVIRSAEPDNP